MVPSLGLTLVLLHCASAWLRLGFVACPVAWDVFHMASPSLVVVVPSCGLTLVCLRCTSSWLRLGRGAGAVTWGSFRVASPGIISADWHGASPLVLDAYLSLHLAKYSP